MDDNEESFDRTEIFWEKSKKEVARELHIQEEINAQQYDLPDGGENDEPGKFASDP
jgi:hypothetical protein